MSIRFRKRVRIAPGVNLNIGKKSLGISGGVKGLGVTLGSQGVHTNVGLLGSGLSYRSKILGGGGGKTSSSKLTSGKVEVNAKVQLDYKTGEIVILDRDNNPLSMDHADIAKKQNRELITSFLEIECEKINSNSDNLAMFHTITPSPYREFTYQVKKFQIDEPEKPFLRSKGFWGTLIPSIGKRIDNDNAKVFSEYEDEIEKWRAHKDIFEKEEKELFDLLIGIDKKDLLEKEKALECIFQEIGFPGETNINFEFSEDQEKLYLNVDLPEIEDLNLTKAKVNRRELRLSIEDISDIQLRKTYMRFIHSILFVIAGMSFHVLPSLKGVIISGYSQRLNKATGTVEDEYLISAKILKDVWMKIDHSNLENIDPVMSFELFELIRDMTKTGIFRKIEPNRS